MTNQEFYVCAGYLAKTLCITAIEVEMPIRRQPNFVSDYGVWTRNYPLPTNSNTAPYYVWQTSNNDDKWGLEIRCYFNSNDQMPQQLFNVLEPRLFQNRPGYLHERRISTNDFIIKLLQNGFILGNNQNYIRIQSFIPSQYLADFDTGYNL